MGEAKRRAAASPYAKTTARQMLRKIEAMAAAVPPAPMNGANEIAMSPADFDRLCARTEVSPFDGRTLNGFRVMRDERLINGVFVGRRNGKPVWSNVPDMQTAIDLYGDPFATPNPTSTVPHGVGQTTGDPS